MMKPRFEMIARYVRSSEENECNQRQQSGDMTHTHRRIPEDDWRFTCEAIAPDDQLFGSGIGEDLEGSISLLAVVVRIVKI